MGRNHNSQERGARELATECEERRRGGRGVWGRGVVRSNRGAVRSNRGSFRPRERSKSDERTEQERRPPTDEPPPTYRVSATLKELVRSVSEHTQTGHEPPLLIQRSERGFLQNSSFLIIWQHKRFCIAVKKG